MDLLPLGETTYMYTSLYVFMYDIAICEEIYVAWTCYLWVYALLENIICVCVLCINKINGLAIMNINQNSKLYVT